MFPQSKRFQEQAAEPTPGPNAYEVKSSLVSDDKTKHFGFIEKSKRFRSPKKEEKKDDASVADDDTGSVTSTAKQPHTTAAIQKKEEMRWKKE
ncbi:hypothetical protein HDV05_007355, partial [Chytridiales sp. JEL 0842]